MENGLSKLSKQICLNKLHARLCDYASEFSQNVWKPIFIYLMMVSYGFHSFLPQLAYSN